MLQFLKKQTVEKNENKAFSGFSYLPEDQYYFDSACQTLRPEEVIRAETDYYHSYNACGERVKYQWGVKVDEAVESTREKLLKLVGKSSKEYAVFFTLNTTYGINLVLQQLPPGNFKRIITSEIEHNSVFLPSLTWSQRHQLPRIILPRDEEGNLLFKQPDAEGTTPDLSQSIVILNTVSNIDGRELKNLSELSKEVHQNGGILLLDGAQNFSHSTENLKKVDFDAVFGSGHKMYGPSIGFAIIKKTLLKTLDHFLVGGGTVSAVEKDSFSLINDEEELHARLELGLQNWAGIIGLGAAIDWIKEYRPNGLTQKQHEETLSKQLFDGLKSQPRVQLMNSSPRTVTSFSVDGLDAHRLGLFLSEQNIMCRSGYFCCHYYLGKIRKTPPLLRVSIGLQNTPTHVDFFLETLKKILTAF